MSILSAHAYTFKSVCDASRAGRMQVFLCLYESERPSIDSKIRKHTHTHTQIHKHNHTARWKITVWAWRINCGIKVLMGNKREKNSYSSPWHRIKLTHFSNALLELLCGAALVAAPQIMLPYLNWLEQGCILCFQRWSASLHLFNVEVEEIC